MRGRSAVWCMQLGELQSTSFQNFATGTYIPKSVDFSTSIDLCERSTVALGSLQSTAYILFKAARSCADSSVSARFATQ